MPFKKTVLHHILDRLPWGEFNALVDRHKSDKHVRALDTKSQFVALAYGQAAGLGGLREIVVSLESHKKQLYHLTADKVARSTLSDANANRPSAVFAAMFAGLCARAHRHLRHDLDDLVHLIDSTSLRLNERSADWARFSADVCGAKVHVIHDPDAGVPVYAAVSAGRVNDITAAQEMPIVPGATYVFDLGYYDYPWWARMHAQGCRIVTRLKRNTKLTLTRERLVAPGGPILSDRIGHLPARQARSRRNPFQDEVREVRVRTETGKVLRILSNDLTAPAQVIADLYQRRWEIELFFRWIKQTLAIRKFIGASENAIRTQVFIALIMFLLMRLVHSAYAGVVRPLDFVRLVRANLMHRRDLDELFGVVGTAAPAPAPAPT